MQGLLANAGGCLLTDDLTQWGFSPCAASGPWLHRVGVGVSSQSLSVLGVGVPAPRRGCTWRPDQPPCSTPLAHTHLSLHVTASREL